MSEEGSVREDVHRNILMTTVDAVYNWTRRSSMWPIAFGLACCAFEMIAAQSARFDLSRFGMEVLRASPRQADLMIVAGTVTHKMAPQVLRLYHQMPEPKYVIAMGACAISGGTYQSYATVQGVDEIMPVDIYIPGCPPRPEAFIEGVMRLHDMVMEQRLQEAPWYGRERS